MGFILSLAGSLLLVMARSHYSRRAAVECSTVLKSLSQLYSAVLILHKPYTVLGGRYRLQLAAMACKHPADAQVNATRHRHTTRHTNKHTYCPCGWGRASHRLESFRSQYSDCNTHTHSLCRWGRASHRLESFEHNFSAPMINGSGLSLLHLTMRLTALGTSYR